MRMKTKIISSLFAMSLCLVLGCGGGGGGGSTDTTPETPPLSISVSGFAQKGPFINGSSITIYELQADLSPTGRSFASQISDNTGKFSLSNVSLSSKYVQLKADGFYYNEVAGSVSSSPLTLYALSDITSRSTVNVNLLSHLEKDRVLYLLGQGKTFADAKKQAQKEILNVFSISRDNMAASETLDISSGGDDNAVLLAISIILQGYRTTAELSELLANIAADIRTDGVLNSGSLGTQLINDAKLIDLSKIRTNLVTRYSQLGLTASIPDFEKYVNTFITNTTYTFTKNIQYPQDGPNGPNILFGTENMTVMETNLAFHYDLAADLPPGTSLKIKLKLLSGSPWFINVLNNWNYTFWNGIDQTFTSIESGKPCSLRLDLFDGTAFTIEYYENNSATPTRLKTYRIVSSPTYTISGSVTQGGSGLPGVTISFNGNMLATTDANGLYSISGVFNGTYTIAPNKLHYTFTPPSLQVEVKGANKTGVNFTAVPFQ
jgi:hypothetical protein